MMKFDPNISYIYARKSSEDKGKQVESIARQIDISQDTSKRYEVGIQKAHILSEEKTASKPGRIVFNELMDIVDKNDHTVIFCWRFNRLSRNSKDDGTLRYFIETGKLTVITPYQVFNVDTNAIVTAVEGAQGTQFSRDLGKMVRDANDRRRKHGIFPGQPSPGYKWAGERGRMKHVPDTHRWQLIHDALHLVFKGTPPMEAWRMLNEEWEYRTPQRRTLGGGPLSKSTWYESVLKNPYYFGQFIAFKNTPDETWMQGNHKPMITEEEFWTIQGILGEAGRPRPRLHGKDRGVYLRLITCGECDNTMSHDRKRHVRCVCKKKYSALNRDKCPDCGLHESQVPKEKKHEYDFWFCPTKKCKQSIFHTEDIEKKAADVLSNITIPNDFIGWAMEYLETQVDDEATSQEAQLEALNHADEENEKELRRLNKLYVKGGYEYEGGEAEYKGQQKELLQKRVNIRKQKAKFTNYADDWREETEEGYRFCRDAEDAFTNPKAHHRTKRNIFSDLVENATVRGEELILEVEPPFMFIKNKLDTIKQKFGLTEPGEIAKLLDDSTNPELIDAIKLTWLATWVSNQKRDTKGEF